jgi:hypothetical protein
MEQFIELIESNPYANGYIIQDGTEETLERDPIAYVGNRLDTYYTVRQNDMIDSIAWRYYRTFVPDAERYWVLIADVNGIENPLDLSAWVGRELLIPDFLTIQLQL